MYMVACRRSRWVYYTIGTGQGSVCSRVYSTGHTNKTKQTTIAFFFPFYSYFFLGTLDKKGLKKPRAKAKKANIAMTYGKEGVGGDVCVCESSVSEKDLKKREPGLLFSEWTI
jgi:hypothetical protein